MAPACGALVHVLRLTRPWRLDDLAAALPARGRFWLDGEPTHPEGRWAFVGAEPSEVRAAHFGEAALAPFDELGGTDELLGDAIELRPSDIPHWITYVAYDAAWSEPHRLGLRTSPRWPRGSVPVTWLGRYERLFAADLVRGDVFALGPSRAACEALVAQVEHGAKRTSARVTSLTSTPREQHREAIQHALEAIAAGTIYQVNLARRWVGKLDGDPLALFVAMRSASPVPLGFYLEIPDASARTAVLARTMERFLRWELPSRRLFTSPIKGTIARRGDDDGEAQRLQSDDKERAEHAMIVDLMRNDLSRVAEIGSVRVESALRVEPFAALSHLVSTVACRTRPGVGARAILEATFPPGSITGTPKLAAMELIEREERAARGVYTGAVGHVDRAGGLSLAVAIRTAVVEGPEVSYFAGGGLVSASDPEREIAETELKARVFLDACAALSGESVPIGDDPARGNVD
jgi:anthranilate/para-aminobenzoate synthase component I